MTKYKVINYFQWGRLKLDKGQVILIEESDKNNSLVRLEHYPEKSQLVSSKAVTSMVSLNKIEKI
jgi:hypothetical protein